KRMPPWFADPEYGKFDNDISLSKEEARALVRWVESGAVRGEGKDPLDGVQQSSGKDTQFGKPDIVLGMDKEQVIPATGTLSRPYFQLSSQTTQDLWVRAVEVQTNRRAAHHAVLYVS